MNSRVKFALSLLVIIVVLIVASLYLWVRHAEQGDVVVKKSADSQRSVAGVCDQVSGDVARITIQSDMAIPRCVKVNANHRLEVTNGTDQTVSVGYNGAEPMAILDSGAIYIDQRSFGERLEPGVHQLRTSGNVTAEIWLVDEQGSGASDLIQVTTLRAGDSITSPVTISGRARGQWYFEAEFPVRILDRTGKELGKTNARAGGEWMTEEFVSFTATITFMAPSTDQGVLVFEKSNPSGLAENTAEFRLPVRFGQAGDKETVQLYYYSESKDKNAQGQVLCSEQGLVAVTREFDLTSTPIQDAIRLLLLGNIMADERAQGISSEFPLEGVSLKGANLKNGVLTLELTDPKNRTSGGSCRTAILWKQIEATAKQFPEVREVKAKPDSVFQP